MNNTLNKILCVDDEQDILKIAQFSLERVGHFTVETCGSGKDALARAENIMADVILLDVMMPGMDGFETFRQLHVMPAMAGTPIVFMTAKVQPSEVNDYEAMGVAGVIAKPFDPMTLPETVTELWQKFHARQASII